MAGKKKTTNTWSNASNQDKNYIQREPPDPPDPPDRATWSRMQMKTEGANENAAQTDDTRSASTKHSFTKTTSEVEETPEQQTLLQEDTPADDPAPITGTIDKGTYSCSLWKSLESLPYVIVPCLRSLFLWCVFVPCLVFGFLCRLYLPQILTK